MEDNLTESVSLANIYRLFRKILKKYRNKPSIIGIDDAPTNFGTSNCQARPRINFSKVSSRDFETDASPNNFHRICRYSNIFTQ